MLRLGRAGWATQNRADRGVSWREAASLLWPQLVIGVAMFACFATAGQTAVLWAAPLAGGLLLGIPLCVVTAHPRVGRWMRQRPFAAIPEEIVPARRLRDPATLTLQPQAEPD
jgi:membrane glycosyltransferase